MLFAWRSCRLKTGTGQLTPGLIPRVSFFFFFFFFCFVFFWSSSCEVGYPTSYLLSSSTVNCFDTLNNDAG